MTASKFDVFISYRRSDSEDAAHRIYDRLRRAFPNGSVFLDVDKIPAANFPKYIRDSIETADAVLVLIGPDWVIDRNGNRRLDDPNDYVRL